MQYTRLLHRPSAATQQFPITLTKSRQRGFVFSLFPAENDVILFSKESMPALAPTGLPIPGVGGELSRWLKSPEHEADHEPPYNAEVKNECS